MEGDEEMKLFSRIGGLFKRAVSAIRRLTRGEMAAGASSVKTRLERMKKLGIDNQAVKKFESYQRLFKSKYGKDIFSPKLSDRAKSEATEIFNMFLADPTTDEKLLRMKYDSLRDSNLVEDVTDIADMAKQVDIVQNRAIAKEIYDVLGSPQIREIWNAFKGGEENKYSNLMKDAILNVTRDLEEDENMQLYTSSERVDMVLSEFNRLKEDYEP